jgi:hypothetical protein
MGFHVQGQYHCNRNFAIEIFCLFSPNNICFLQVKPQDLSTFLEGCRQDGYVIVAAEQTTGSYRLDHFKFPAKTVILLG